jgi:glycosyltransferase involved in cell wall biosynthesis
VDASVIIPTFGRPEKILACVEALATQGTRSFEVLVGFDGPDPDGAQAVRDCWAREGGEDSRLTVIEYPHRGYTPVRNDLLALARGRIMISANDDIVPAPGFVNAHVREHGMAAAQGRSVLVSGASPFVMHADDTLLDRLMRETSMVFFHDVMTRYTEPDAREKDWGFRHCYGLNFSAPMEQVRELGGFTILPTIYGYEDIECAFRVSQRFGSPVLYRPEALAWHDHRFGAKEYAAREHKLGVAALGFARVCPECALATFGRDIASEAEMEYSREYVERERSMAMAAWETFQQFENLPASLLDGDSGATLRAALYQQHMPFKRWLWRRGLLEAFEQPVAATPG